MEANSWRSSQAAAVDWRTQLRPEARLRIIDRTMETLKKHLPISVPEGLNELQKIANRFEEKIYTAATSQSDYLKKISLKVLSMESKTQPPPTINPAISNSVVVNQNSIDQASIDSTGQTGPAGAVDWQEEIYQKVQSATLQILSSAISDIGSVVSMIDRIAGSAPGNGSRAAAGEDLVAMTKCRLQARNFMSQDGNASTTKKMKCDTSAMPLNNVSSAGSVNDSFKESYSLDTSELQSTATSRVKRQKIEVNHALVEEIWDINQQLIDTVVNVSEEDSDSVASVSEGGEGTVIKCSFTAVSLSPSLKSQFSSAHLSPILSLRLLVPANYPKCSPVLLDKLPDEQSGQSDDLSTKAKSRFSISLRGLSQPMSLGEMAKTWDACARKVIVEYAQQPGGGSFSSRYGAWENCAGA